MAVMYPLTSVVKSNEYRSERSSGLKVTLKYEGDIWEFFHAGDQRGSHGTFLALATAMNAVNMVKTLHNNIVDLAGVVVVWVELYSAHPEKGGAAGAEQRQVQQRQAAMWAGVDQVCAGGLTLGVAMKYQTSKVRTGRIGTLASSTFLYFSLI